MQDTGHPGITSKHNRNTPGCIFPCYGHFLSQKTPLMHVMHLYKPCDVIATEMMPPSGRAHPHVYTFQV